MRHFVWTSKVLAIRESESSFTIKSKFLIKGSIDEMKQGPAGFCYPRHRAFHRTGLTYMPGLLSDGVPDTPSWMGAEGPLPYIGAW